MSTFTPEQLKTIIENIDDFRGYVENTVKPFLEDYGFSYLSNVEQETDKELVYLQHHLHNKILRKGKLGKCGKITFKKEVEVNEKYLNITIECPQYNKTFELNCSLKSYYNNND